jgi:hypothetical protein
LTSPLAAALYTAMTVDCCIATSAPAREAAARRAQDSHGRLEKRAAAGGRPTTRGLYSGKK